MNDHSPHQPATGPSCPLLCGSVSLVRWLLARCSHASRAAGMIVAALLFAASYNAAQPLGICSLPGDGHARRKGG